MPVSKVQRTTNITGSVIYAVYGTHEHMRDRDVRAALTTVEARGIGSPMAFAMQAVRDVHGGHLRRSNEALVLVQSWHPDVLDKDNPQDVEAAHYAGMELAREIASDSDFLIATHLDGKAGHVHNHIIIVNHNYATGKTPKEAGNWHYVSRANDVISRKMGFDVREQSVLGHEVGREPMSYSETERHALAAGRCIDSDGFSVNEVTSDTWRDFMRARIEELLDDPAVVNAPDVNAGIAAMQRQAHKYHLSFITDGGGSVRKRDPTKAAGMAPASAFQLIDDDGIPIRYRTRKKKRTRVARTSGKRLGSDYEYLSLCKSIHEQQQLRQQERIRQVEYTQNLERIENAAKYTAPKQDGGQAVRVDVQGAGYSLRQRGDEGVVSGRVGLGADSGDAPERRPRSSRASESRKRLDNANARARQIARAASADNSRHQGTSAGDGFDDTQCRNRSRNHGQTTGPIHDALPKSERSDSGNSDTASRDGRHSQRHTGARARAANSKRQRRQAAEFLHERASEARDSEDDIEFGG